MRIMKKLLKYGKLVLIGTTMLFAGCKNKNNNEEGNLNVIEDQTTTEEKKYQEGDSFAPNGKPIVEGDFKSNMVTLPNLKTIQYDKRKVKEPTDEEAIVYVKLNDAINATPVYDDSFKAELGDQVWCEVSAKFNGEDLPNVSFKKGGENISLGGGAKLPKEAEEKIVGMHQNEEKDFSITYPEDYWNKDVRGLKVDYHVKVVQIAKTKEPSAVDIAKAKEMLKDQDKDAAIAHNETALKQEIIKESTIECYPQGVIEELKKAFGAELESKFGPLDKYKAQLTEEEYNDQMYEYVFKHVDEEMVLRALAEKTGITMGSQMYNDYAQAFNISGNDALWKAILSEVAKGA